MSATFDAQAMFLSNSSKFAIIALSGGWAKLPSFVELAPDAAAFGALPFGLPAHWASWLGELVATDFKTCNFVLLVSAPTSRPDISDNEKQELEWRVRALFYATLLIGPVRYEHEYLFSGSLDRNGELSVQSWTRMERYFVPRALRWLRVEPDHLKLAHRLSSQIESHCGGSTNFESTRFRRGFTALIGAFRERWSNERLHQSVRALDGLCNLGPRQGRKKFAERCLAFVTGANAFEAFEQMYAIRSAVEHVHDFRTAFNVDWHGRPEPEVAEERAAQAEFAAREAYRRILGDHDLMNDFFSTDAGLDRWWSLSDDERRRRFGAAIDLDSMPLQPDEYRQR